jgi:hypothetical protein
MGLSNAFKGLSNAVAQGLFFDRHVLCDNRGKSMISPNILSRSRIMVEQHFSLMSND